MLKKVIEDFRLAKLSYLLDQLKTKDLKKKFKIFKTLDNMKITSEMGLKILEASLFDYGVRDGNGGINSSLFSLCLKDYKKEYTSKIKKNFNMYDDECKDRIMYLLSNIDNEDVLKLYADLVLKYYKNKDFIPVSNLYERIHSYNILFPKLYKAVNFNGYKNNIVILINDYLNAGVIPDADIKKHKRLLQNAVNKILTESLKYKFPSTSKALQDEEYTKLRFYLEVAINIEYYVSTKKTSDLLSKVFKKNDNQLKLFILENYIRKVKSIKRMNLTSIAKDPASRYPLYELLNVYNLLDAFPKNYLKQEKLAESDLYINFSLINGYKESPKCFKYIKKIEVDEHEYYVFTFNYSYYPDINYDITTNYLIEEAGLSKYKNKKITNTFIGLSGGYDIGGSIVTTTNNKILWHIKKDNEEIDDVINKIVESLNINKKSKKEEIKDNEEDFIFEEEIKKRKFKFGYILIFLLFILILSFITFITILQRPDLIPISINENNKFVVEDKKQVLTTIKNAEKFKEISGHDIFKQSEENYYVLLYKKKNKTNKSVYYNYINKLIDNNFVIYCVDLSKEENHFLYKQNELGFTLGSDRYLKVENGDFSFYVDGKTNIVDELESELNSVIKTTKK